MRDYRTELADLRCWDREVQAVFDAHGEALLDCALQNREEVIGLCEFIEQHNIRSYLEIGIWTGQLLSTLHRIFQFDRIAACDHGWAAQQGLPMHIPADAHFLQADSDSPAFASWRASLGHIDLVMIDANHHYHAVKHDFEQNRRYPHRFLALHDITGASRQTAGVGRLWSELTGWKQPILRPHVALGLPHSIMGIGVWSEQAPEAW